MSTPSSNSQSTSRLQTALLIAVLVAASINPIKDWLYPAPMLEGRISDLEATNLEISDGLRDLSGSLSAANAGLRKSSENLSDQIGELASSGGGVSAGIAALKERVGTLDLISSRLDDLDAALRRMSGQLVIDEPTTEVRARIQAVLEQWLPPEDPGELPESSDELREELDLLQSSMQTRMRISGSEDLETLEWWADALDALNAEISTALASPTRMRQLSDLLLAAPVRAPSWTLERLDARVFDHTVAMIDADLAGLAKGDLRSGSTPETLAEYRLVLADLAKAATARASTSARDRVTNLSTLVDSLLERQKATLLDDTIQGLRAERDRILQLSDEQIRVELLFGLTGKAASILVDFDGEQASRLLAQVQSWRRDTESRSTELQERRRLRYQKWALAEIDAFVLKYNKQKSTFGDDEVGIAEAMIAHLISIDVSLLEGSIQSYFSDYWQKAWSDLDYGEKIGEKNHLLRKVSEVRKRGIDSV